MRVEAVDSLGRVGWDEDGFEVNGDMKLGAFDVAFDDASWSSSITELTMTRAYSTLDRDRVGDFGFGWRLSVGGIEVTTNGPLGAGGWQQQGCGEGFIFLPVCNSSTKPHVVAVRYPDDSVEVFDFGVAPGNTFFKAISTPVFTPRRGTQSSLRVADTADATLLVGADGNLYRDLSFQDLYAPKRYLLTTRDGNELLLDVDLGLVETRDRAGNRVRYTRDGVIPDHGLGVRYTRDALDRIVRIDLPDENALHYHYDTAGDLVRVDDVDGTTASFVYDDAHRLLHYGLDGRDPISFQEYDADGRLIGRSDARGVFVETVSDVIGWTETTIGPDPRRSTTLRYDADGLLVEAFDLSPEAALQTLYTYDADYRPVEVRSPAGAITRLGWDPKGRLLSHEDADGVVQSWTYSELGDMLTASIDGVLRGSATYDAQGNLLEQRAADGSLLASFTYNTWGALDSWTSADGRTGRLLLDAKDQLTGLEINGRTVTFTLDAMGRGVGMRDGEGDYGTAVVDSRGNVTEYRDPRGHVERWTWDERGDLVAQTDKAGRTMSSTYDDDGRVLTTTSRNGDVLTYDYDVAGRLSEVTGPDTWVRYTYDALDRLILVENPDQSIELVYDLDGRLVTETTTGLVAETVHTTWTPEGRPVRTELSHGWQQLAWDDRGRPLSLTDSRTGTTTWGWDDDDLLRSRSRSTGLLTEATYTGDQRLARLRTTDGPQTIQDLRLTRDAHGQIIAKEDALGAHSYAYDARGQLTEATHDAASGLQAEQYAYDTNGNRLDGTTDEADRLVETEAYAYDFDHEGRALSRVDKQTGARTTYAWDSFDRLRRVEHPDGVVTTMRYDGLGRRIELVHASVTRRFVYAGGDLIAARDEAGALQSWVTRAGWELIAEWTATGVREAVLDHMGSRVGWYAAGVHHKTPRDSFGRGVADIGPSGLDLDALTWHAQDPTGLVYMQARCYDPDTGRFLSEDPIEASNRYAYAFNNPISAWDPYGLSIDHISPAPPAAAARARRHASVSLTRSS